MRNETANWTLDNMLQKRAFSELSEAQQHWVLQKISAEEYQQQRWVILSSKDFFAEDPVPGPPSLESILHARKKPLEGFNLFSFLGNLSYWRVPAWQLGMAIICGWIFGQWNAGEKNQGLSLVPQIVYQTDTIVKEIPVYIGLGKQRFAAYQDSQKQKQTPVANYPGRQQKSTRVNTTSIVHDRDLLELAVGMQ